MAAEPAAAADWQPWAGQSATAPRAIFTSGANDQGALLTCDADGHLAAVLSLKPASLPDQLAKNAYMSRDESAKISVGDSDISEARLTVVPAQDVVQTSKHSVAAKVFNAAVRGEALKVSMKRAGEIDIVLPTPNDTFKAFADNCSKKRAPSTES